jgi:hypothetical protein
VAAPEAVLAVEEVVQEAVDEEAWLLTSAVDE